MQAVNLLPADAVQKRKRQSAVSELSARKTLQVGGAVVALFAVLMAGLYLYQRSVVNDKKSDLAQAQARLVGLQARAEPIRQQQADAAARLGVVQRIAETRMNWDRTMGDMARVLPADAYLTSLQASAPATTPTPATTSADTSSTTTTTTTTTPTSTSLTMSGVTPSHVRVATLLDRLALLPWLSNVTLQTSTRGADGRASFTLSGLVSEVH